MTASIGVVLSNNHSFTRDPAPTAPQFQLVVRLRNYTPNPTDCGRPILENRARKSHDSTLAEFLSLGPARATLMSTLSFPDVDLLSHAHLGPSIMRYAEEEARVGARLTRLTKLKVVATVICIAGLDGECAGREVMPPATPAKLTYRYRSASTASFLELMRWGEGEGEGGRSCAVCLEEFGSGETVVRMPCRHVFHRHCIVNWMHQRNSCPLCRCCLPKRRKRRKSNEQ